MWTCSILSCELCLYAWGIILLCPLVTIRTPHGALFCYASYLPYALHRGHYFVMPVSYHMYSTWGIILLCPLVSICTPRGALYFMPVSYHMHSTICLRPYLTYLYLLCHISLLIMQSGFESSEALLFSYVQVSYFVVYCNFLLRVIWLFCTVCWWKVRFTGQDMRHDSNDN
jgi:hypothetical protein